MSYTLISMIVVSALLNPWVVIAGAGHLIIWLLHKLRIRDSIVALLIIGGGIGLVELIKVIVARPRPPYTLIDVTGYSFPSGHAAGSVLIVAVIVYVFFPLVKNRHMRALLYVVLCAFVILVGFSRIYLGVHYISDVIGGYIVGSLWVIIVMIFTRKKHKRVTRSSVKSVK